MAIIATPFQNQPPPDVPNLPAADDALTNYLRRFALWCRNGFAAKLDAQSAAPGFLVASYDAAHGTTPKVWMIRVDSTGTLSTIQIPTGGGKP